MELSGRRYPIGIQNFEQLRTRNCVYVDKTELVYKLVNTDQIYFFSRPVGLAKACSCLRWRPISRGKRNFSKGWLWNVWSRNGRFARCCTLISA